MRFIMLLFITIFCAISGCSDNAVEMTVDFSWHGINSCSDISPEIHIIRIPEETVELHVKMFDKTNAYKHGGGTILNDGSGVIPKGALKKYSGPCPSYGSPRYEFTIEAINAEGNVIGRGKKMRRYPPE